MKAIRNRPLELWRNKHATLLGLALLGCLACSSHNSETLYADSTRLLPGSLILRRGEGLLSTLFSQVASREQNYSHCGILDYDSLAKQWIVWHAYQDRSEEVNGVSGQSLRTFISESEAIAIYPSTLLDSLALQRMRAYIEDRKVGGRYSKPFDTHFDLRDTNSIYCTEFVALAYQASGVPAYQSMPTGHHIGLPYPYYTLDDITAGREEVLLIRK